MFGSTASVIMFGLFFVICLSCTGSVAQVTLGLVGGKSCSGDNLTFLCEASGTDTLVWTISALPGTTIPMNNFGTSLTVFDRITSTDDTAGADPSMITIHNVTEADRGATVQCRIVKGNMSNIITLSIRPIECSVILISSAATDTSVTVTIIWTNCLGTEPESVSLRWSPTEDPNTVSTRDINTQTPAIITGLQPNTSYTIMVNFSDACGSIANMTNAVTQPERIASPPTRPSPTAASPTTASPTTASPTTASPTTASPTTAPSFSDGCGGITAGVAVGCLFLSLLASVATGVITFFCTRRCYKKSSPPPPNEKSVYYETIQSDSVQMQPSPAYESVEKKM